jgi:Fe-S cluster assembly protein SufD
VRHIRVQRESVDAFHFATCAVRLERDARYLASSVALGARISRLNLTVTQAGEGAESEIDGLALIGGRQLADTHSLLDHTLPHGRSRQLHKCIVDGAARAVFNGKIFVRAGAQRTDSTQESRNLLLSERAQVDTKPQLEIFADDVKCAHGATVGQLEPEQVFYLKSRGLDEAIARDLLTFAFAAELVHRIPIPSLVRRLEQSIVRQTQNRKTR